MRLSLEGFANNVGARPAPPATPAKRPKSDADYALLPLALRFEDSDACALLGPSGCGETTMCNITAGLVRRGPVEVKGRRGAAAPLLPCLLRLVLDADRRSTRTLVPAKAGPGVASRRGGRVGSSPSHRIRADEAMERSPRDHSTFALSRRPLSISSNLACCHCWFAIIADAICGLASSKLGILASRTSSSRITCQPNWVLTGVCVY